LAVFLIAISSVSYADQWKSVTSTERLTEIYNNNHMEGKLTEHAKWRTEYCADGTGTQRAWGVTFGRTWKVKGENQVCITQEQDGITNCYIFEQNVNNSNKYRAKNVATQDIWVFTLVDSKPTSCTKPKDSVKTKDTSADTSKIKQKSGGPNAAAMAKKLANPSLAIGQMTSNFIITSFRGELPDSSAQDSFQYQFQPVLPFPLENGKSIMLRPAVQVMFDQPVFNASSNSYDEVGVELGDIPFDLIYGGTSKSGLILSYGLAGTLPTATSDKIGKDQWLLGPEILVGQTFKWGLLGVLVNHQWDIAGDDAKNTSVTGGQYFYGINIGGGTYITSGPGFSYDHEATSGNKTTFPLGFGVSKTTTIGSRIWKFAVNYFYYVEQPEIFGPQHQLKFTITPVVELPWGKS